MKIVFPFLSSSFFTLFLPFSGNKPFCISSLFHRYVSWHAPAFCSSYFKLVQRIVSLNIRKLTIYPPLYRASCHLRIQEETWILQVKSFFTLRRQDFTWTCMWFSLSLVIVFLICMKLHFPPFFILSQSLFCFATGMRWPCVPFTLPLVGKSTLILRLKVWQPAFFLLTADLYHFDAYPHHHQHQRKFPNLRFFFKLKTNLQTWQGNAFHLFCINFSLE